MLSVSSGMSRVVSVMIQHAYVVRAFHCSGAADESLRFWKVFEKPAAPALKQKGSRSVLNSVGIR